MSKRTLATVFAAFAVMATIGYAATTVSLKDVKCIMAADKDAKEDKAAEWKDGKVFFCCDGCPKAASTKRPSSIQTPGRSGDSASAGSCPMNRWR